MRDKNYARMILLRGREEEEEERGNEGTVTTMRKKRDKMGRGKGRGLWREGNERDAKERGKGNLCCKQ